MKLGNNCIQNIHLGKYIVRYRVKSLEYVNVSWIIKLLFVSRVMNYSINLKRVYSSIYLRYYGKNSLLKANAPTKTMDNE